MRYAFKISVFGLAATVLLVVMLGSAVMVAGNTHSGRALIERWTYRLSAGHMKLSGLGGSFPTHLTLEELQLIDGRGVWLTAGGLSLRWTPLRLLDRRVQVDTLQLARLHIERAPISERHHRGGGSIPYLEVGQFSVDMVELGAPLAGTAVNLSVQGSVRLRSLEDANAEVVAHRLGGEGEYTLHVRFDAKRMDASLAVHEPASGPLENMLSLPGLGALSATATLEGSYEAGRLDVVLSAGDLHARVQGGIDMTHKSANLDYSLSAPAMEPRPGIAWAGLALRGKLHGSVSAPTGEGRLDIDRLRIAGSLEAAKFRADLAANAGKLAVHAVAEGLLIPGPGPRFFARDPLKIDASLQLDEASRPLELTATHPWFSLHGHAATAADNTGVRRAAIELRLPDLAPFAALAGQNVRGSAAITTHLVHRPNDDAFTLDADVGLTGGTAGWIGFAGPRVALQLSGNLSDESLKIDSVRIVSRALALAASASATRRSRTDGRSDAQSFAAKFIKDLQARWRLEISDLATVSSDIAGNLKMSGRLNGSPASMAADADLTSRVSVRGSASGTVEASLHARGLPAAPNGTLQAHGMIDGAPLNLDATVQAGGGNALRMFIRQVDWKSAHLDGDITAAANLTQSRGQLRLRIGQLSDLDRLLGLSMSGGLEGNAGFMPAQGHVQAQLQLDSGNLVIGQFAGGLHIHALGGSDALATQVTVQLPDAYGAPANLTSASVLNLDKRRLLVASASLNYRGEAIRLLNPVGLSFGKGLFVDDLKMGARDAVFELKGQLAPTLDLFASLRHVKPALINVFSPGLLSGGSLEAQARLRGSLSSPAGRVRVDASDIRFADDAAIGLPALDMRAHAELSNDAASVNAKLSAGPNSQLTVSGAAPLDTKGALDLKIDGKLDAGLANPFLEARGMRAAGQLTFDAMVTGSAAAPQLGGGFTLVQGSWRDYGHGVNLSNINAEIVGHQSVLQVKTFKASAASGSIEMTGTVGLLQPGLPLDLRVTAKDAQPIASSIMTANLNADLHVSGAARKRVDIAGTVHVNHATIGIPNSMPPDVAILDVRRRGRGAAAVEAEKQLLIGIDVAIQAPRQILVQGRGLDAELGGEIRLSGTAGAPRASGGFDLQRGSFTLAGSKLSFTQGRVSFDAAGLRKKIDPTLDFTAQSTLTDAVATLRITGVADAPRFDFSSSPALPQDEIMARLLFGEAAAQLTALQVAQIGAALATLSGVGGNGLNPLVKLQKSLGLDRLNVGANTMNTAPGTEGSGAAIEAGRYVSKRVYVEGRQSTTGNSQLLVDVDLTKHLKLQTRLGNGTAITQGTTPENDPGSSVGLSYQFEY